KATRRIALVAADDLGWSDVGSFATLPEVRELDAQGNAVSGDALTIDCADCVVLADAGRLVAVAGMKGACVIDGVDALLVGPLARGFSRGVRATGVDVCSIGIVPTPLTYFAANTLPVDGLCMITGSHNPPDYNGFKVGIGKSTLAGSEIQELKERVLHPKARGA